MGYNVQPIYKQIFHKDNTAYNLDQIFCQNYSSGELE